MDKEYLAKCKYDWGTDPNGYRLLYDGGSYPDPKRCFHCGLTFLSDNYKLPYCGSCSKAMSMGGEDMLYGFNAVVENARVCVPDKDIDKIDWERFKFQMIVDFMIHKYQNLLTFNKNKFGLIPPGPDQITATWDEVKVKVPMKQIIDPNTGRLPVEFQSADKLM